MSETCGASGEHIQLIQAAQEVHRLFAEAAPLEDQAQELKEKAKVIWYEATE